MYNEDLYGPINLDAWRWRWQLMNLKYLVVEDGRQQSDIKEILERDDGHNKFLMKKTVIRLMLHQDSDLRLLPIYFDRLKMFVKIRKLFRYILKKVNR